MTKSQERDVCIRLPNKQQLDCTVGVKAKGQAVLNKVSELLGVEELNVFGLAVFRDSEYLFLDLEQKLRYYFGKKWSKGSLMEPFVLHLKVQFYVQSGQLILSSDIQQLYYSELRQKLLSSQCRHQEALFFQLAAAALQAEHGDNEQRQGDKDDKKNYFLPQDYFPDWLINRRGRDYILQNTPALHGEMRGVSSSQAVLLFIKEACALQDGTVTFYGMKQEKSELRSSVLLGLAMKGVHVYQEVEGKRCLLYNFSWTNIDRLTFQGRRFEIHAVGSQCLPKLTYYPPSAFHAKHIMGHLRATHQFHINTRETVRYIQLLEEKQASCHYREAYICDLAGLRKRLHCSIGGDSRTSSVMDNTIAVETPAATATPAPWVWPKEAVEGTVEVEMCVDDPEEVLVDDPADVLWLVEQSHGVSVDGPLVPPASCWADITMEMKQVLKRKLKDEISVSV